ncbi:hypothetical protein BUZ67_09440 [Staphylococcus pasteuri]|nr:hypothetical protein BUZ67_09440 [Staphylococcus pasteuri]
MDYERSFYMVQNKENKTTYPEFEGNCYTREMKYPIKVYYLFKGRSFEIPMPEGMELRKLIVGIVTAIFVLTLMIIAFITGNDWIRNLILNRGIIITAGMVFLAVFIVYQIDYGNKSIYRFYMDNLSYLLTKHRRYEHYDKVNKNLENAKIQYSNFVIKEEVNEFEKSNGTNQVSD